MKTIFYFSIFIMSFLSCNTKQIKQEETKQEEDKRYQQLLEKELELRERDLNLREEEFQLNKNIIDNGFLSNNEVRKNKTSKEIVSKPEKLFQEWEEYLKKKGIFDYVSEEDCEDLDKMMDLYDKGKYPMHTSSMTIIPFDYNKDNVKDYLINYSLSNCVQGTGNSTDFIFLTSRNGNLYINELLTNRLKIKIKNYVTENYDSDQYINIDNNNFIEVNTFKIIDIINNTCYGTFNLMQGGNSCCPRISGLFTYDITKNKFSVDNLKENDWMEGS